MKTSELIGPALDWAVAKCEGKNYRVKEKDDLSKHIVILRPVPCPDKKPGCCVTHYKGDYYSPSTAWSQGGPIIAREKITTSFNPDYEIWEADITNKEGDAFIIGHGHTPLIAAMRCYVASKLGNEVEIPEELK